MLQQNVTAFSRPDKAALHAVWAYPDDRARPLPAVQPRQNGVDFPRVSGLHFPDIPVEQLTPNFHSGDTVTVHKLKFLPIRRPCSSAPVIPPPVDGPFRPVNRHLLFNECGNKTLTGGHLAVLLLLDLRLLLHVTGEVQRFASLPAGLCLRPQLVDNIVGQVAPHGFGVRLLAHVHGAKSPSYW